tara:strand:- start:567 stop:764 length:198 start_codon:yes stop_codon:yes gene_type:complete
MIEEESLPHKPIPLMACCGLFVDSVGLKGPIAEELCQRCYQAGEIRMFWTCAEVVGKHYVEGELV